MTNWECSSDRIYTRNIFVGGAVSLQVGSRWAWLSRIAGWIAKSKKGSLCTSDRSIGRRWEAVKLCMQLDRLLLRRLWQHTRVCWCENKGERTARRGSQCDRVCPSLATDGVCAPVPCAADRLTEVTRLKHLELRVLCGQPAHDCVESKDSFPSQKFRLLGAFSEFSGDLFWEA